MLTWNQYKKLNENRNLNEAVVQQKYQVYLSQIELNEYLSNVGGAGNFRIECNPNNGIGMYLTLDAGEVLGVIKGLLRMEYQGDDEAGQPTYAATILSVGGSATLNYDYGVGKWKFMIIGSTNTDVYYSDTLISSNWVGTASDGFPTASFTTCGYREFPVYCVNNDGFLVQPLPAWLDSQNVNTEVPQAWTGFVLTFIWLPAIGGDDGWYLFTAEAEGGVLGGSVNELPIGEVPLGEGSVTVSEGACAF